MRVPLRSARVVFVNPMSVRRVDDESGFSPSSLDTSISALADRLPGATRLSHVLAIGAKFKLEQQGKQSEQLQQQQRKLVNTDGYDRGGRFSRLEGYTYQAWVVPTKAQPYFNAVALFLANPGNQTNQTRVMQECVAMLTTPANFSGSDITAKDLDYLRKQDGYILLNFIRNSYPGPPAKTTDPLAPDPEDKRNKTAKRLHDVSTALLKESLYRDREYPNDGINNPVAMLARDQLMKSQMYLAPRDNRFEVRIGLLNSRFVESDTMELDESIDGERYETMARQKRKLKQARDEANNVHPKYQELVDGSKMWMYEEKK